METNRIKPTRNFYDTHTKKDLSASKKGSQWSRMPPENKSETNPKSVSEKPMGNTSSTKSKSKGEVGDQSLLEFSNNSTSIGRYKGGRNENLVFSSSGVFRVDEMGDHKANYNPEKNAHSRYKSTNRSVSSAERKESKPIESEKKTLKKEKHSKALRACLESDQSQDEECEMARGTANESEMLGGLKNLSVNRSPQWDAISTERLPQHATPNPKGSWMRR